MTARVRHQIRTIALTAGLFTVAALLPTTPASQAADEAQPLTTSDTPADVSTGPIDLNLAVAQALGSGEPVVVDTLSAPDRQIQANPDGTFTAELSAGPVRVRDASDPSGWTPIDTNLVDTPTGIRPKAAAADYVFSSGGKAPMATLAIDKETSFSIGWADPLPSPSVAGNTATYTDVTPGIDLFLSAHPQGFEQGFLVNRPPTQPLEIEVPLDLSGLTGSIGKAGGLTLTDARGQVAIASDAAQMWGANPPGKEFLSQHTLVPTEIVKTQGGLVMRLSPDPKFFEDPNLQYPVTIDPSPTLSDFKDNYVDSAHPTTSYGTDVNLKVGTPDGSEKARSLVKFSAGVFSGTHVLSATLNLWENYSASCTGSKMNVKSITSSWTGPTWNVQPTYGSIYASGTFAKGFSASCPAGTVSLSSGGSGSNTLTTLAQAWADGTITNEGVALIADTETSASSWKIFNSVDNGSNPPTMSVTYNSYPKAPWGLAPKPGAYVNTTQPTLHGRFCDADGGFGRVDYQIVNFTSGTSVVNSPAARATVPSCTDSTWVVPSGNLTDGSHYKFRAQGGDSTDVGTFTGYTGFWVDTTAPSTPTISSSTHPSQTTWYGNGATSFSASWTTATDATSGVAGYAIAFDQNATFTPGLITQIGTTYSTTIDSPGVWYLHIAAIDAAGNVGTVSSFGVHRAGFTTPFDQDRTQKYFTLKVQGDPSDTQATIKYRKSPSDAAGWQNVPTADVTIGGTAISSWPVTLTSGVSSQMVWDAASTLGGVDGPVQLEIVFGTSPSVTTSPIDLALDQMIIGDSQPLGPGSVDLITGNFTLSAVDVAIGNLSVGRSFDSRNPSGLSGGIFGPGWTSGLESSSAYTLLHEDTTAGTATISLADGEKLFFQQQSGGAWTPGATTDLTLVLTKTTGPTMFTLAEADGFKTTFTKPSGATDYTPSQSQEAGANTAMTFSYQVTGGVAQPTQILDVVPAGLGSACATLVRGCRALSFTYATMTTATGTGSGQWGDYVGQVKSISFTGWDPAAGGGSGAMTTTAVASYLYDSNARLRASWDPRISPALKTTYAYDASGHVITLTPPGLNAWTVNYGTISGDANAGRVLSASRPGVPSGTATTTVVYNVPLTGSSAPYLMGSADVAVWGQLDFPTDATAIFPPGHDPVGNPPSSYDWASVTYLDRNANDVNTAQSNGAGGGYISTSEYDEVGNQIRSLSPGNRATALATGFTIATHQAQAALLDSQSVYSSDGSEPVDTYGPIHTIELADGSITQARQHTHISYDQGAPSGLCPCYLPTTVSDGALVLGGSSDLDVRVSTTDYDWGTLSNRGTLQPTVQNLDPSGLTLVSKTIYDASGRVTETRLPAGPAGGDAHSTDSYYYAADSSSGVGSCNNKPEWAGMLCETKPAAQPAMGNTLAVTTYTYDLWLDPVTKTEVISSPPATRISSNSYDVAGRLRIRSVSGPGAVTQDVTTDYDLTSGLPTTSAAGGLTVSRHYDALGRLDSYTDADFNVATYTYDLQGRPTSVNDGKGIDTLTYDGGTERRGLATSLSDSLVGAFGTNYDANGSLVIQTYPNGMSAATGFDETGAATSLVYTKTANCSTACDWYREQVVPSIHGQWLAQNSSLSSQDFAYDAAGRLTWALDTVGGQCTTRQYAYDADSNRTSLNTRQPGTNGACDTTSAGTVISSTYDSGDRATKSGYAFDALGRTTQVPSSDNDGSNTLSLAYYSDDRVKSLTTAGVTDSFSNDPLSRARQLTSTSGANQTWHYATDSDSTSWIAENAAGTAWTRSIASSVGLQVASVNQAGVTVLQVTDLRGDVIATASNSMTATSLTSAADQTEFGGVRVSATARFGWLGGYGRTTDSATGASIMGARVYLPSVGRFMQVDPIFGGSANAYDYTGQDPINRTDLAGTNWYCADATGCVNSIWKWGWRNLKDTGYGSAARQIYTVSGDVQITMKPSFLVTGEAQVVLGGDSRSQHIGPTGYTFTFHGPNFNYALTLDVRLAFNTVLTSVNPNADIFSYNIRYYGRHRGCPAGSHKVFF